MRLQGLLFAKTVQSLLVSHGSKESLWVRGVQLVLFDLKYSWPNFLREIITLRIDWTTKDKVHVPKMVCVKQAEKALETRWQPSGATPI